MENFTTKILMVLVTQSFGKESEYRRAIFAIWTYWAYCPKRNVLLFTDAPTFFRKYFENQPIEYVLLTPDKIKSMRGEIDFLHRMKITLIEEAFQMTNENLLYIDSDTFFIADPTPLMNSVSENRTFMHLKEYRFDSLRQMKLPAAKPFHAFIDLISNSTFKNANDSSVSVSPFQYSWNAGVIMLHSSHVKFLTDVYALTDKFYPPTQNHASEQYAFSIVLQSRTELSECTSVIYHYWYRVKKQIMDRFLDEKINNQWSNLTTVKKTSMVKKWAGMLPSYFNNHILLLRDNAIQAFHENDFKKAYYFALKSFIISPWDRKFLMDLMYHTKRLIGGQKN